MVVTSHSSLRGQRDTQEDAHIILQKGNTHLWGVFDGHGGAFISAFLKKNLPKAILKYPFPLTESKIERLFDAIQDNLIENHYKKAVYQGSTCVAIVRSAEHMTIMNVGDSRAVLCRNNETIPLSVDHKPNESMERIRIEKLGGESQITKAQGDDWRIVNLSVSRSFGDLDATPYVTHKPDVKIIANHIDDQFVILACDGLWDVMTNEMAVKFILDHSEQKDDIGKLLAKEAIQLGTSDNVTAVVVWF